MQQYAIAFEITRDGFDWSFSAIGLLLVLVGIVTIRRRQPGYNSGYLAIAIGLLWIPVTFFMMYRAYAKCWREYETGHNVVVEGAVEDFHPMPFQGHQDECFSVHGVKFCYSDYVVGCGFNNTSSHGGPIRLGLPVRVSYQGNSIFKLEIKSDRVPSHAEVWKRDIGVIGRYIIGFWPVLFIFGGLKFIMWLHSKLPPIGS
jgi:hypothetical protein